MRFVDKCWPEVDADSVITEKSRAIDLEKWKNEDVARQNCLFLNLSGGNHFLLGIRTLKKDFSHRVVDLENRNNENAA